jgi:predicted GNAT superfamily acetyltransferase
MSLVKGSINPLNVLGVRRLSYIPNHFTKMTINGINADRVDCWIYQNLDSRYSITKSLKIDSNNKMVEIHELGVEDAKELTILSLSCPYLDKNI